MIIVATQNTFLTYINLSLSEFSLNPDWHKCDSLVKVDDTNHLNLAINEKHFKPFELSNVF